MYIINGIAYAGQKSGDILVNDFRILDDFIMIVTFSTGEQRLFDATCLLDLPAFKPLESEDVFRNVKIEYGVVVWNDGEIDIAPEMMYEKSYAYETYVA